MPKAFVAIGLQPSLSRKVFLRTMLPNRHVVLNQIDNARFEYEETVINVAAFFNRFLLEFDDLITFKTNGAEPPARPDSRDGRVAVMFSRKVIVRTISRSVMASP